MHTHQFETSGTKSAGSETVIDMDVRLPWDATGGMVVVADSALQNITNTGNENGNYRSTQNQSKNVLGDSWVNMRFTYTTQNQSKNVLGAPAG